MSTAEGKTLPILSVHFKPSYSLSLGIFYDVIYSLGIADVREVQKTSLKYLLEFKKNLRWTFLCL